MSAQYDGRKPEQPFSTEADLIRVELEQCNDDLWEVMRERDKGWATVEMLLEALHVYQSAFAEIQRMSGWKESEATLWAGPTLQHADDFARSVIVKTPPKAQPPKGQKAASYIIGGTA